MFDIPLAWLQLSRERLRLLVALAGIAFAVILMFMQLGFQAALYDSATRFHQSLQADIVLIGARSRSLAFMRPFSWRRLYQAFSVEGVESISPIYVGFKEWKNPENGSLRVIYVYGFEPDKSVFKLPEVAQNLDQLRLQENILFDRASRKEYGSIATEFEQGESISTELGGKQVNVVGLFTLGPSFGADGNIIMSDLNFLNIFTDRKLGEIDIGLIQLKSGADVETVAQTMRSSYPNDVKVLTHQGFIEFEKNYWKTSTAIGFIFTLGVGMGFIVGTVIVYQILYTDVSDHLAEYATLKAMGYKNLYLEFVVFQEAIILAVLGYIPGFALSLGLYDLTKSATFLPLGMTIGRIFSILILTVLMCFISGLIAMRKLRKADPADIF
ncbi:FtsX-like permease family protein [Oscillatoria sp. FACHB-1407]|uniref:ABC transporter permease DevC n=1 Tax=Oscillatoria sp. FACHB-1407 TaxID=2692847 RepID=UPI00168833DA|nr:ABC transporter permease DevC [Oscillatoria sp. FACHB-1407]MBD2464429.1 FtsX-like permease family protein [Oscillatoria sp. FACHB-1407]